MWYWLADPSSANTTNFCNFNNNGNSNNNNASNEGGVAPMSNVSIRASVPTCRIQNDRNR